MDFASPDFRFWLQAGLFALLVLAAWRWGAGPERALAGVLAWFGIGDALNHAIFGSWTDFATVDTGHLVIELVALGVALSVALLANRMYPLWFSAFQLIALFAHLARDLAQGIAPLAYLIMYIGPSYCQIILLSGGIWLHRRRVRRHGPYRSWRSFSHRSPAMRRPNWPSGF